MEIRVTAESEPRRGEGKGTPVSSRSPLVWVVSPPQPALGSSKPSQGASPVNPTWLTVTVTLAAVSWRAEMVTSAGVKKWEGGCWRRIVSFTGAACRRLLGSLVN